MAKCPVCGTRKGKRECPALDQAICSTCCGRHRLDKIQCPPDCTHLGGEHYQHKRRGERAQSRGKAFISRLDGRFPDPGPRRFAWAVCSDLYWWQAHLATPTNREVAEALTDTAERIATTIHLGTPPTPLVEYLTFLIREGKNYKAAEESASLTGERKRRTLEVAANAARSHDAGSESSTSYCQEIASFFNELNFSADLDYKPTEEFKGAEVSPELRALLEQMQEDPQTLSRQPQAPQSAGGERESGLLLPGDSLRGGPLS